MPPRQAFPPQEAQSVPGQSSSRQPGHPAQHQPDSPPQAGRVLVDQAQQAGHRQGGGYLASRQAGPVQGDYPASRPVGDAAQGGQSDDSDDSDDLVESQPMVPGAPIYGHGDLLRFMQQIPAQAHKVGTALAFAYSRRWNSRLLEYPLYALWDLVFSNLTHDNPEILVASQYRLFDYPHAPDDSFSSERGHLDELIPDIVILRLRLTPRNGLATGALMTPRDAFHWDKFKVKGASVPVIVEIKRAVSRRLTGEAFKKVFDVNIAQAQAEAEKQGLRLFLDNRYREQEFVVLIVTLGEWWSWLQIERPPEGEGVRQENVDPPLSHSMHVDMDTDDPNDPDYKDEEGKGIVVIVPISTDDAVAMLSDFPGEAEDDSGADEEHQVDEEHEAHEEHEEHEAGDDDDDEEEESDEEDKSDALDASPDHRRTDSERGAPNVLFSKPGVERNKNLFGQESVIALDSDQASPSSDRWSLPMILGSAISNQRLWWLREHLQHL
ncbi:hypothetical protein BS47DRAFT_1353687 [Hydnum rufescens UP504]|uniref:Uncharacterized protein n=1 Tax=Hydnum rufescens UP504 TaxID=1448309 RepID=A0A9P6AI45_9AGAM|nr:hypothetical protein BS47DRAFT_1353687 [Hydnum rufescens UP504]